MALQMQAMVIRLKSTANIQQLHNSQRRFCNMPQRATAAFRQLPLHLNKTKQVITTCSELC